MYTVQRTPLAKLRAYQGELTSLYQAALRRHDQREARRLYELRRRVRRAMLIRQEWGESFLPDTVQTAA